MKKLKPITEWGLDGKALGIVQRELLILFKHFGQFADIRFTDGVLKNISRSDFGSMDFFYFTDCRDILAKNPEQKGVEMNLEVRNRKRAKLLTILMARLLGRDVDRKIKCSHCGFDEGFEDGFKDGSGHYTFCPKCFKTTFCIYPPGYNNCISLLKESLEKRGFYFAKEKDN